MLHCRAAPCAQQLDQPPWPRVGQRTLCLCTLSMASLAQPCCMLGPCSIVLFGGGPWQAVFARGLQLIARQRGRTGKSTAGMGPVPTGRVTELPTFPERIRCVHSPLSPRLVCSTGFTDHELPHFAMGLGFPDSQSHV